MAKSHYLIGCALIFCSGAILLMMDHTQIGLCLSVPSVLVGAIIAIIEPSASPQAQTMGSSRPAMVVPAQPATAKDADKTPYPPKPATASPTATVAPESSRERIAPTVTRQTVVDSQDEQVRELTEALATLRKETDALAKLANDKSREAESLASRLKDRRDIKILQRVAQFQHVLEFNRLMMNSGKIAPDAALREFEFELESAMDALGIKVHPIDIGSKVRDLPNGSFELINGEPPSSPELAGTVKAVRQSALTYTDPEGDTHFLIPAKIDAYKLS